MAFDVPLAEWGEPLAPDGLTVEARCRVVRGNEDEATLAFVGSATVTTVVVDDASERAILAYRPLLPDEDGC